MPGPIKHNRHTGTISPIVPQKTDPTVKKLIKSLLGAPFSRTSKRKFLVTLKNLTNRTVDVQLPHLTEIFVDQKASALAKQTLSKTDQSQVINRRDTYAQSLSENRSDINKAIDHLYITYKADDSRDLTHLSKEAFKTTFLAHLKTIDDTENPSTIKISLKEMALFSESLDLSIVTAEIKINQEQALNNFKAELEANFQDLLKPFDDNDMPGILALLANYVKDDNWGVIDDAVKTYIKQALPLALRPIAYALFSLTKFIFMKLVVESPEMQKLLSSEDLKLARNQINTSLDQIVENLIDVYEPHFAEIISDSTDKNDQANNIQTLKNTLSNIQNIVSEDATNDNHYLLMLLKQVSGNNAFKDTIGSFLGSMLDGPGTKQSPMTKMIISLATTLADDFIPESTPLSSTQKLGIQNIIGKNIENIIVNIIAGSAKDSNIDARNEKREFYQQQFDEMRTALDGNSPVMVLVARLIKTDSNKTILPDTLSKTLSQFSDSTTLKGVLGTTGALLGEGFMTQIQTPESYDIDKIEGAVENIIKAFVSGFGTSILSTVLIDSSKVQTESKSDGLGFGLLAALFNPKLTDKKTVLTYDALKNTAKEFLGPKSPYYDLGMNILDEVTTLIQSVAENPKYDNLNPTARGLLTGILKNNIDTVGANDNLLHLTDVSIGGNVLNVATTVAYTGYRASITGSLAIASATYSGISMIGSTMGNIAIMTGLMAEDQPEMKIGPHPTEKKVEQATEANQSYLGAALSYFSW